jgi:hypothetical protein
LHQLTAFFAESQIAASEIWNKQNDENRAVTFQKPMFSNSSS